ncbi:hypothetical protein [Stenotrophomonas sp.]|uniref:hypothetical protein n=1 Tax=Stenotrophomonas sp. TaxID=69392 RepID=UPI00289A397B|nr:hypothetical protein [Stenotrophomonas sp.]
MPTGLPTKNGKGGIPLKVGNAPDAPGVSQQAKPRQSQQQRFLDRDFDAFLKGVEKSMSKLPLQKISRAG